MNSDDSVRALAVSGEQPGGILSDESRDPDAAPGSGEDVRYRPAPVVPDSPDLREAAERLRRDVTPGPFQTIGGWVHAIPPERLADLRAVLAVVRPTVTAEWLTEALHAAFEWQYDECDHGTYAGGSSNGEPYAMCAIFARFVADRAVVRPDEQGGA